MELTHQEVVDRLIVLKGVRDYFDEIYESERKAYTDAELERTSLPRGDESALGSIVASFTKPVKGATVVEFVVEDEAALMADRDEDAMEYFKTTWWPAHKAAFAEDWFYESGAVLDGCATLQTHEPDVPKTFRFFMVKPSEESRDLVSDALKTNVEWLLGSPVEDGEA